MRYITLEQVLYVHDLLIVKLGGTKGVRDIKMLESALYRPQVTFDGIEMYSGIYAKASVVMHGIIKNHPFIDGNKRTGIHSGLMLLRLNDIKIKIKNHEIVKLALDIATDQMDLNSIENWLVNHTV